VPQCPSIRIISWNAPLDPSQKPTVTKWHVPFKPDGNAHILQHMCELCVNESTGWSREVTGSTILLLQEFERSERQHCKESLRRLRKVWFTWSQLCFYAEQDGTEITRRTRSFDHPILWRDPGTYTPTPLLPTTRLLWHKDEKWEKASCTMGKRHAPFKQDGTVHLDITHTYAKALSLHGQEATYYGLWNQYGLRPLWRCHRDYEKDITSFYNNDEWQQQRKFCGENNAIGSDNVIMMRWESAKRRGSMWIPTSQTLCQAKGCRGYKTFVPNRPCNTMSQNKGPMSYIPFIRLLGYYVKKTRS